jgi:hypothetical protein
MSSSTTVKLWRSAACRTLKANAGLHRHPSGYAYRLAASPAAVEELRQMLRKLPRSVADTRDRAADCLREGLRKAGVPEA